ncbi:hypothetical protein CDL12_15327 [Handroanthus impetiginosus]|uniref:Uncharacterized protein n=1 Tax=Handroanthus impetiginosus TaxID=429701 RepID=A0A2G9H3I0_9LAMI|nr:hypothetical protein CDL12_15327 [Handroanthus impetiginosus]
MATTFSPFRAPIVCSAATPDPSHRRNLTPAAQSKTWWAPLFGWSGEPDYINICKKIEANQVVSAQSVRESGRVVPEKNLFRGCFTEEKARELRRKMIETSTFHDDMYHSAIASRLASDVDRRDR